MGIAQSILEASSLEALGVILLVWLGGRLIDKILGRLLDKKIFASIVQGVVKKWKAFQTRFDPLEATYELSFSPRRDVSMVNAPDLVDRIFEACEEASRGKVEFGKVQWDRSKEEANVSADFEKEDYEYDVDLSLATDPDSLREPGDDERVGHITFKINFSFEFHALDASMHNMRSFISFLQKGSKQASDGTFSKGRFIIQPVKNDLTLDEWIEREQFDVSLLLATEDKETQVEFFHDKAIVQPPYNEIDGETVRYIRATLLNYYL